MVNIRDCWKDLKDTKYYIIEEPDSRRQVVQLWMEEEEYEHLGLQIVGTDIIAFNQWTSESKKEFDQLNVLAEIDLTNLEIKIMRHKS